MKLITKLVGLVVIFVAMILTLAYLAWLNANSSAGALTTIAREDIPLNTAISNITATQLEQSIWLYRGLLGSQLESEHAVAEAAFEFEDRGNQIMAQIDAAIADVTAAINGNAEIAEDDHQFLMLSQLEGLKTTYANLFSEGQGLLDLIQQGNLAQAELSLPNVELDVEEMNQTLLDTTAQMSSQTVTGAIEAVDRAEAASQDMMMVTLIAFLLSLLFGALVIASVRRQLGTDPAILLRIAGALAEGRLGMEARSAKQGVYRAIGATIKRLRDVIRAIQVGSDQVASASEQVMQGNIDLSSRTQEQASSLEEVAASMEEMAGTVTQNASNAKQAEKLAKEAQAKATNGSNVVSQAVTAMDKIEETSSRITEILEMIEEISFQTNLLSLNAAVEAARAGEQGRGFAVVANEVRSLAGRSSKAAKDIKSMIQDSITNVNNGMRLVNDSGAMLGEIVEAVRGVTDIVTEIAAANVEQSEGIAQVNKAVIQMEGMTQQNAALVEQAAAASQSMGHEARELKGLVAFFRLTEQDDANEQPKVVDVQNDEDNGAQADSDNKPTASSAPTEPTQQQPESDDSGDWVRF